jgi:carboxyl-terminal processing protease
MRIRRAAGGTFLAILFCVLALCAQGPNRAAPGESNPAPNSNSDFQGAVKQFAKVYRLVQANYASPIDPNNAIFGPSGSTMVGAIPAMLRALDPHSNFFDPSRYAALRQEMEGDYYGVGMEIGPRLDRKGKMVTEVISPLPDSPAFEAGLRPGDVIWKVDQQDTRSMYYTEVVNLLKGPKGTEVRVTVKREGVKQPLGFTLTRQKITELSVDSAFIIRPGIAYIHINTFNNELTDDQLSAALKQLGQKNLKGLILDLRGNLGGIVNQAVLVASHFLRTHQLVVYHYGRNSALERSYVQNGEVGPEYPMVVLIDGNTASAAEIVSGALQDHDRALIVGQRSFGKGLVQSEFPLSDKTMLLLVTARYYTPSGRLIQRNYSDLSLYDYFNHYNLAPLPHNQARLTDGGRVVYGGGGIAPDVLLPAQIADAAERELNGHSAFLDFGRSYLASHKTVRRDFSPDHKVMEEFRKFLATEHISVSNEDFHADEAFIRDHIQAQIVSAIYGGEAGQTILAEGDPVLQEALKYLPQAAQLLVNRKRYMALRGHE